MNSDREAQQDELAALESIYPDVISFDGEFSLSLRFDDLRVRVQLPEDYPTVSMPTFQISAPAWNIAQKKDLEETLRTDSVEQMGCPILYTWVTTIKDFLLDNGLAREDVEEEEETGGSDAEVVRIPRQEETTVRIISGETFSDRKSTFQAHFSLLSCREDVNSVMRKLLSNNKIARATHNIVAWRLKEDRDGRIISMHDCEDDGETGASAKMLEILEKMNADNVIVVVTRWYGGIHLGPDRFRIINNLTRQILADNGMEGRKQK